MYTDRGDEQLHRPTYQNCSLPMNPNTCIPGIRQVPVCCRARTVGPSRPNPTRLVRRESQSLPCPARCRAGRAARAEPGRRATARPRRGRGTGILHVPGRIGLLLRASTKIVRRRPNYSSAIHGPHRLARRAHARAATPLASHEATRPYDPTGASTTGGLTPPEPPGVHRRDRPTPAGLHGHGGRPTSRPARRATRRRARHLPPRRRRRPMRPTTPRRLPKARAARLRRRRSPQGGAQRRAFARRRRARASRLDGGGEAPCLDPAAPARPPRPCASGDAGHSATRP